MYHMMYTAQTWYKIATMGNKIFVKLPGVFCMLRYICVLFYWINK